MEDIFLLFNEASQLHLLSNIYRRALSVFLNIENFKMHTALWATVLAEYLIIRERKKSFKVFPGLIPETICRCHCFTSSWVFIVQSKLEDITSWPPHSPTVHYLVCCNGTSHLATEHHNIIERLKMWRGGNLSTFYFAFLPCTFNYCMVRNTQMTSMRRKVYVLLWEKEKFEARPSLFFCTQLCTTTCTQIY